MSLKRFLLALACVVLLSPCAYAENGTVHFFVVPAAIKAQDVNKLNDFLAASAGGFTVSRSQGGSRSATGKAHTSDKLSYLVAADRDLSPEIMDYLKTQCGLAKVFMLVWEADRPGL